MAALAIINFYFFIMVISKTRYIIYLDLIMINTYVHSLANKLHLYISLQRQYGYFDIGLVTRDV